MGVWGIGRLGVWGRNRNDLSNQNNRNNLNNLNNRNNRNNPNNQNNRNNLSNQNNRTCLTAGEDGRAQNVEPNGIPSLMGRVREGLDWLNVVVW